MDVERIEITSAGLFALLREDFTSLVEAKNETARDQLATKILHRILQINGLANVAPAIPTASLRTVVETVQKVLVSQAERRSKRKASGLQLVGRAQPQRSNRRSA
jgi:hypothetical protein